MAANKKRWRRLLAALIFVVLHSFTPTCHSNNTDNDDLRSLMSFKSGITGDPLNSLSSWSWTNLASNGTRSRRCVWSGVVCRSSAGGRVRVFSLRLRGLGLVGTISPSLGNLTRLRVLDLSGNKLQGEIPPSLGSCLALRKLNLSANLLSGTLPSSMGQWSKLLVLNIRHNNFSSIIPSSFANLTAITFFSISSCGFHGNIPQWLANWTMLIHLNIAGNMMSGHVPPVFSKLTKLRFINLSFNQLEGAVHPSLFNLSYLEALYLGSNNRLSGSLPPDMGLMLPNLNELELFYNNFGGQIPASLSNISVLEAFNIHGNRFQGRIPPNIGRSGVLQTFEVGYNELQATEPRDWSFLTSLANCSNLHGFSIQLNNLSGILPKIIANLSQELQYILAGGNRIAGHIPEGIGRYYKLTRLEFSENLLTGTIPSDIGKLSNLHELSLQYNQLVGKIPLSLGNMTQLNSLLLSTNYLEGRIPATLGNLSMLRSIDVSDNLLTGQVPQEIISISSLTILCNLSSNALSGPIPPQIGHLVNLVVLDLSSNKLSGEIPSTIGNCLELQELYLRGNLLGGQIPKGLSALRGVQVLDLSDNRLSGPIPEFLEGFQFLKSLNLSFNHFSGPVPWGGIFSNNATSVSLDSNGALCGGPIVFNFPACPSQGPVHRKHRLMLIFSVVGATLLVMICTAGCYFIKRLTRSSPGGDNGDEYSAFLNALVYQRISYAELHAATNSFSQENLIGHGSLGTVYKGSFSRGTHSMDIAVKVLDVRERGASRSLMAECSALKRIRHRKLVKVVTVCDGLDYKGGEFKAIVLELVSNGSLDKWLHPTTEGSTGNNMIGPLSLMQRLSIALDVAEALEYLHHQISPCIVHCDIKPSNILLDDELIAHICDFGLAKIMNAEASGSEGFGESSSSAGIKGTIGYVPPEYGLGTEISKEGDVFSYGVLLLEILTGRRPTDPSFHHDSTSLPKYVEAAYPDKLMEVVDRSMPPPQNGEIRDLVVDLFVAPVSRLGLACCSVYPSHRVNMIEVAKELSAIKKACQQKF